MNTQIGRSKRARTRFSWIANLPEVGTPILRSLDQLNAQAKEIADLQAQLHAGRASLLQEISSLWTAEEIAAAKR